MLSTMSRVDLRLVALGIIIGVMVLGLSIPFYLNLKRNALRAEARLNLATIATLERVHFTDSRAYVYFEESYGAQTNGRENCQQPPGAVELGFQVRRCNHPASERGPRYVFEVRPSDVAGTEGFTARALSGSDIDGEDLVCGGRNARDEWTITERQKEPEQVRDCE